MSPKIYVDMHSQPCRAVIIFCRVNGLDFEQKNVSLFAGEHKSEWFLKINPRHTVPAMEDGDLTLTQSSSILYHLTRTQKVAEHWYPADTRQRALVDEYISWHNASGGTRANGVGFFMAQAVTPAMSGKPANKAEVEIKIQNLNACLDQIESYFLSHGPYIAGNDITLADLLSICELMQPNSVGFDLVTKRPRLAAWLKRVKGKLQPHFDDGHKLINEFGSKYKL